MKSTCRVLWGLLAACCLVAVAANSVVAGNAGRPAGNVKVLCENANAATEARYQSVASTWRQYVTDLRSLSRLKRVATDAAGFEEKVSQGFDLFNTPTGRADRMRVSIRKHVVDEKVLAKSMVDSFAAYQQELFNATVNLYGNAGIGKAAAQKAFPTVKLDPAPVERAFDPVVKKANSLAAEDWFRFALVNVGSDIDADGVEEFGRSRGNWNVEEGSLGDFFAGLVIQLAADVALDTLTDPTDQFAKELQTSMVNAERELLDGPSGLLTAMRKLTTFHQKSRRQHLGLAVNGGK